MSVDYDYNDKNYYAILGVARNAGDHEIKAAFRRCARQYHPDLNPGSDAARRFTDIKEAYEILSDPVRRHSYDSAGAPATTSRTRTRPHATATPRPAPTPHPARSGAVAQAWRNFLREETQALALIAAWVGRPLRRFGLPVALILAALLLGASAGKALDDRLVPSGVAGNTGLPARGAVHPRRGEARYLYGACVSTCPASPVQPRPLTQPRYLYGVCVSGCTQASRKK